MRSFFALLAHRSYRRLWIAQILSDFGNFFDFIALEALIVYEWGLTAGALAAFAFAVGLPWVLIGPWMALLVDRFSKKKLMIVCTLLRVPFVVGFILAPNLYWLLPLVFFKEILDVLFDPARQASLRSLVPRNRLQQANALSQLSLNTAKIAAPAFGGFLFAVSGSDTVFLLEAGGFLLAAILLRGLPAEEKVFRNVSASPPTWRDLTAGVRVIRSNRLLIFVIGAATLTMSIIWLYDKLIILWANSLGMGVEAFGLIPGVIAAGSILGAFFVASLNPLFRSPLTMVSLSILLGSFLLLVIGMGGLEWFSLPFPLWLVVWFAAGVLAPLIHVPYATLLQSESPREMVGRIVATANALQNSTMLISPMLGAALAGRIGVGGVFLLAGVVSGVFSLFGLWFVRRVLLKKAEPIGERAS